MAEAEKVAAAQVATLEADQFEALLVKEFKPKTDRARSEVEGAVRTLAEQALRESTVVSDDVIGTIKAIIAEIDKKLSDQMNLILHSERFQQLESAWRGLNYLVSNTETDEMLKIRVLNVSKKELAKTLKKYKGVAWDQSPIFKRLYEQEYGQLGGEPAGGVGSRGEGGRQQSAGGECARRGGRSSSCNAGLKHGADRASQQEHGQKKQEASQV